MKNFLCFIWRCFSCPVAIFTGMIAISVLSLGGAIASELFLGLEPCKLCIYQRWPFVIAIVIGIFGLIARKDKRAAIGFTVLGGLTFLANSVIAFYHTGVEQKWWVSAVEGCAVPNFDTGDQSWLENLMSAPSKPCDVIPWQDPLIGLSMANYNTLLCFGLFAACMIAAYRLKKSSVSFQV